MERAWRGLNDDDIVGIPPGQAIGRVAGLRVQVAPSQAVDRLTFGFNQAWFHCSQDCLSHWHYIQLAIATKAEHSNSNALKPKVSGWSSDLMTQCWQLVKGRHSGGVCCQAINSSTSCTSCGAARSASTVKCLVGIVVAIPTCFVFHDDHKNAM